MTDADEVASVESDDIVAEQEQLFAGSRRAVSSGEPSLDGSVDDDEREALSDSDLGAVARASTIASQVKGPSSDALEEECFAEAKARLEPSHCEHTKPSQLTESQEEWDDILGSGQLLKKTLLKGTSERQPKDGYWVKINVANLIHPSDSHQNLSLILGFGMAIDALELVVKLMQLGEKCCVKSDARFAYGNAGLPPDIGPAEAQTYEIELLEIGTSPKFSAMPAHELEEFLAMLRDRGRFYFKREEFDKAIFVYKRGTSIIDVPEGDADDDIAIRKSLSTLHSNIATCYEKLDEIDPALTSTSEALRLDPSNVKALYRRSTTLARKNLIEEAIDYLHRALALSPNDVGMLAFLQGLRATRKRQKEQERARCRRMLAGAGLADGKEPGVLSRLFHGILSKRSGFLLAFFVLTLALFVHFLIQASIYNASSDSTD